MAGNEHTVVLCSSGEVFAAGYNDNGQCGQGAGHRVEGLTRVPIPEGVRAVQVGSYVPQACKQLETCVTCSTVVKGREGKGSAG